MNPVAAFIRRPVGTTLLTLGIALAGMLAYGLLPVAALPQVDFPTISVQASLPGASPETMAATVATPLERSLGKIAGVSEMTSSSSLGSTRIVLQFDLNRDIDGAARDVQAAINAARASLPTSLPSNPTYRKMNPADAPILILALSSETKTRGQMYDIASTVLAQKLSQVEGVGQVTISGSSLPAVRVELNLPALNKYGIGSEEVRTAIAASNANRPKGLVEDDDRHWQIAANDQAKSAADYRPLVVAWRNGAPVRLTDVANVIDSVQDVRNVGILNNRPAVALTIYKQPNANTVETVDRIKTLLPQLRAAVPAAIDIDVTQDRTPTIRAALVEVQRAVLIAIGLVVLAVFLFLRSARATVIPAVAVTVSLLGTFAVMYLAGYSLNNLSLMALTVATGFVVDDAIIVLENVSRHLERGETPMAAALAGAREVSFTVLAISLSLIAVFIPILLMGGIVGRFFREFAVVLTTSIVISLVISLTATPMMCARVLRGPGKPPGRVLGGIGRAFATGYRRSLGVALDHPVLTLLVLAATVGLNVWLYITIPKGFIPQQDTGRMFGWLQADQSSSFQSVRSKLERYVELVRSDPAVDQVVGFSGGARNNGMVFISLKPLAERHVTSEEVIERLRPKLAQVPGANLWLSIAQDVRVGGRMGGASYQYTFLGEDLGELRAWEPRIRQALSRLPELADVSTDAQDKGTQTSLVIDRDAAARLGVPIRLIDATLNNAFGQRIVSTIYDPLNQYRVVMEAAPQYTQSAQSLESTWVGLPDGTQVPLAAFSRYETTFAPLSVNHQGSFVASTVSFNLPRGVSLGEATTAIEREIVRLGVPTSIRGGFQGTARAFAASLDNQPWLILAAIVTIYLVLGILYENLVHPITILTTLPSAGVGALLALMAFDTEFSIIALIGVILLVGIVKKNAIMLIDFAVGARRDRGLAPREAIFEACLLRFRPIMMTTLAAMLGALPLAIGFGEGAELRQPLGISVFGGLLLSQVLTLYTTPVTYLWLERMRIAFARWRAHPPAPAAKGAHANP